MTLSAAAGSALALPGKANAASNRSCPVQRTWSSESTAEGYAPKSGTWYTDPAAGLAAVAHKLSRQDDLALTSAGDDFGQVINVDPALAYQSMLGIGTSIEDSTVYNLSMMSSSKRNEVLRALFHPKKGAGFNLARICFGSSDFHRSQDFYTYDDGEADPDLANFSIQKDIDNGIIETVTKALDINPDLVLCGTAWSPPAWMKDNGSLIDGHLLDEHIPTLARYYRMTVEAYAEQGIHLHAVTPQNEPGWPAGIYPSCLVSAEQAERLITLMRAEFDEAGLTTEIWAWDWNFGDTKDYLVDSLGTTESGYTEAHDDITAIAWHDYAGDPSAMSLAKAEYPDLDMVMTERMLWGTTGAERIARYLRAWSTGYIAWVTMLDQNRNFQQLGKPDPTPFIQSPTDRDQYWALPEYYIFGQFSKFVQRGAKRIWSDKGSIGTVTTVAFLNPDDTIATVVINQSHSDQEFTLRSGAHQVTDTIPAKTVGTYVWAAQAGTATDAYGIVQAEAYKDASGIGVEVTAGTQGGENLAWIGDGDWVRYDDIAFGDTPATRFTARIASGAAQDVMGDIEIRLDSPANDPVGTLPVTTTGGWQNWINATAEVATVTGTHDVYLTFASGQSGDFANLNWFTFGEPAPDPEIDPYTTIEAEAYNTASGVQVESNDSASGGQDIGWIGNGDWVQFNNVAFGDTPAVGLAAQVASGAADGVTGDVEIRLDELANAPIGRFSVSNTGGWTTWTTKTADLTPVTGTHTVYMTFTSGQASDFVNVDWFSFNR
jgi:O-glycosyl hydrolase